MLRFKLGAILGFAAGWAVGSGRAIEMWQRLRSNRRRRPPRGGRLPVPRPGFDRSASETHDGGSTAVSA